MKRMAFILTCLLGGLLVSVQVVSAGTLNFTFTMLADSTLDGFPGTILRNAEPFVPTQDFFVFQELGMYRVYAVRTAGSTWTTWATPRYFSGVSSMIVGQTWRGVDTDIGQQTLATVAAFETITVPAGTFSCYRIDITTASMPFVIQSYWVADGMGEVKEKIWEGSGYSIGELQSFSITGTGFFPTTVGNLWDFTDVFVPVQETTWGKLKAQYR